MLWKVLEDYTILGRSCPQFLGQQRSSQHLDMGYTAGKGTKLRLKLKMYAVRNKQSHSRATTQEGMGISSRNAKGH